MGARWLWLATAGVTAELIEQESKRLGVGMEPAENDYADNKGVVTPKGAALSEEDSIRLRNAVYKRLGIDDAEEYESTRMRSLPAFKEWKRKRKQEGKSLTWQRD
jgi:hypothetical protein